MNRPTFGLPHREPGCTQRDHGGVRATAAVVLIAAWVNVLAELPAPRNPLKVNALAALVEHLELAHAVERLRFAAIALDELARSYEHELHAESRDRRPREDAQSVARWRAAARETIATTRALAGSLPATGDITVFLDPGDVLRFIVDGRTVMVDAPRVSSPHTLNQRITARYCAAAPCAGIFGPAPYGPATGEVTAWSSWSFGSKQPALLETSTGLSFGFRDMTALASRRRMGQQLASELERSARELAWHRERGLAVDWQVLHLARLPGSGTTALVVNPAGDYLALDVPVHALPREPLARWYQARMAGRRFRYLFVDGDAVFAPSPRGPGDGGA